MSLSSDVTLRNAMIEILQFIKTEQLILSN